MMRGTGNEVLRRAKRAQIISSENTSPYLMHDDLGGGLNDGYTAVTGFIDDRCRCASF